MPSFRRGVFLFACQLAAIPVALLLAVLMATPAAASMNAPLNGGRVALDPAALFAGAAFDPAVPTLQDVTGVSPAERPLRPDEVLTWFRALDEASPFAKLVEFGRTFEGRPLVMLAISDAATIDRLDDFRREHVERLDPRRGPAAGAPPLSEAKAVALLAYGIHGDELSSTDAACALAWWLVAGTDAKAEALRRDLVILIDPCENPDGRARYLAQVESFAHQSANPDQEDLSHTGVWPWGRGNHYLFDLNRDWIPMRLPESARAREVAAWLPQLLVDSHEMGSDSSYLFPPARHPFNPHRPLTVRKWEKAFSDEQAHALDARGYPYFSGEWNEEFFPGYGSSWVVYHGGIGILYEMSRTTGTLVRKHDGTERTFAQAVEHQVISTLANLESLRSRRAEILADHRAARAEAVAQGRQGACRAWLFTPDARHPQRLPELAEILTQQGIEVQALAGDRAVSTTATDARTGKRESRALAPGSLLVRLDQPAGLLARAVLDPHVPMNDVFFRDEREYLEKEKGSRLYDTTAWSLPLLRGVPAAWSGSVPAGDWQPWAATTAPAAPGAPTGAWGSLVVDADPDGSGRLLAELLQKGVTVRVARKPFTIDGRSYAPGALVVRREGNLPDLDAVLAGLESRAPMQAVATSRVQSGPDLGGSEFDVLVAPRVGVLAGMPVASDDYGHVWHLLDQELGLRFSSLDAGRFARVDLSRYNVLVFPPVMGGVGMYRQVLGQGGLQRLRQWIEAGGTAIGFDGGARMLADSTLTLTESRFRAQVVETFPSPVWSIPAVMAEQAGRPTATGLRPAAAPKPGPETSPAPAPDPTAGRASPYDVAPILGPGAAPFAVGTPQGTPLGGAPRRLDEWLQDALPVGRKGPEAIDRARADERLRRFMPQGALLRAQLDPEEWLGYGLDGEIAVWFGAEDALIAQPPATVAASFPDLDRLHLGGLLWPEGAARLARTAYATRENVGRGQVILFAGAPAWRRWLRDSERLLVNAVLLGPGLGTRWSTPW